MKRSKSKFLQRLFMVSIYASAFFFFAVQVRDVLIKYFERKTTISTSQKILAEIPITTVTICSGLNFRVSTDWSLLSYDYGETPSLFEQSTYKLGKDFEIQMRLYIGSKVFYGNAQKEGINLLTYKDNNISKNIMVDVKEFATPGRGLCYAIDIDHALNDTEHYVRMFMVNNFPGDETKGFTAIISNKTAKFSALFNNWKGFNSINVDLEEGLATKVVLTQSINMQLEEKGLCQTYDEGESQPQCLLKQALLEGISNILGNCPSPCLIPVLESYMTNTYQNASKWNYCRYYNESECTAYNAIYEYSPDVAVCQQSCFQVEFTGKLQHSEAVFVYPELFLYFESMTEKVYEELLLFDLPSFIGNIGGSLGLFIGFSYLDFATKASNAMVKFLTKRK